MADCEFTLPCESNISSNDNALEITNNGDGGVIRATSVSSPSVAASSTDGSGILGVSKSNHGVRGISSEKSGIFGSVMGASGFFPMPSGVYGDSRSAPGVAGSSGDNFGVVGRSARHAGMVGIGDSDSATDDSEGVIGTSKKDVGVLGICDTTSIGVMGQSLQGSGVYGWGTPGVQGVTTAPGDGVVGHALRQGIGVKGRSVRGTGVDGSSSFGYGVNGESNGGVFSVGVRGSSTEGFFSIGLAGFAGEGALSVGVYGTSGTGINALAGLFAGDVDVTGSLSKGGGGFKIDHPLDPENQYLSHSFVESSEMKNVYDGVVSLDHNGEGVVELPEWFETLNSDFRYQITAIGQPAPNLHIAREIANNCFTIAGGKSAMKISWQVTGVRQDAWATANRIKVEEGKSADEQGYYRHPAEYKQPPENSTLWKGDCAAMHEFGQQQQDVTDCEFKQTNKQLDRLRQKLKRRALHDIVRACDHE